MTATQGLPARLLPDRVADHLRFVRARRAWQGVGVAFVHIPKNGGTSISRALYGRTLGHYRAAEIARRDPRLLPRISSFAVLRDPVERAISAYRFATAGATGDMAVANPERYRSALFADFTTFVCSWLAQQDLRAVDGIFRTQTSYVTIDGRVAVDELYWLADLQPLLATMRSRGFPGLVVTRSNVTDKTTAVRVSDDAAQVLREVYRADYDLIGARGW